MKTITIFPSDITPNLKFLSQKTSDGLEQLDLMGQILHIGYGIKLQPKTPTPACQETIIHPFTVLVREAVHNTDLTLSLLRLASLPGSKQLRKANEILAPHGIQLISGDPPRSSAPTSQESPQQPSSTPVQSPTQSPTSPSTQSQRPLLSHSFKLGPNQIKWVNHLIKAHIQGKTPNRILTHCSPITASYSVIGAIYEALNISLPEKRVVPVEDQRLLSLLSLRSLSFPLPLSSPYNSLINLNNLTKLNFKQLSEKITQYASHLFFSPA